MKGLGRGIFYFLVFMLSAFAVVFLIKVSVEQPNLLGGYSAMVGALATVSIAALTCVLALETWRMRNQQYAQIQKQRTDEVKPLVVFELAEGRVINDRTMVIKNLGRGIAYDVSFEIRRYNPGLKSEDVLVDRLNAHGVIKKGIRNLGIGQEIESHVVLINEMGKDFLETCVDVEVFYKDIFGNPLRNSFTLDFSEYENVNRLGGKVGFERNDHLKQIAETLIKIERSFPKR